MCFLNGDAQNWIQYSRWGLVSQLRWQLGTGAISATCPLVPVSLGSSCSKSDVGWCWLTFGTCTFDPPSAVLQEKKEEELPTAYILWGVQSCCHWPEEERTVFAASAAQQQILGVRSGPSWGLSSSPVLPAPGTFLAGRIAFPISWTDKMQVFSFLLADLLYLTFEN